MTLPELALQWILADPRISTVIPGTREGEHVKANNAVSDGQSLDPDLLGRLNAHCWARTPKR